MAFTDSLLGRTPTSARRPRRRWLQLGFAVVLVDPQATGCGGGDAPQHNTVVETQVQEVLEQAVSNPDVVLPGAAAHYRSPQYASWSGAAGLGDTDAAVPMRPHDKFRAGSFIKPFVAAVVLQHVEEGTLQLEQTLPELLAPTVTDQISNAEAITLRMLLSHTSGIPEWSTLEVDLEVAADPLRIWEPEEFIELASLQPAVFDPGTSWSYSNTNYTLVGMVLEGAAGEPWRQQVRERVIEPLGLEHTTLPEPGDPSIAGDYARGYHPAGDQVFDFTLVDPTMADAAGGHALITNTQDAARFLEALLAGELFDDGATMAAFTSWVEAPVDGFSHFYGLGIEKFVIDGVDLVGHGGGAAGYNCGIYQTTINGATVALATNSGDGMANAEQILIPVVEVMVADAL